MSRFLRRIRTSPDVMMILHVVLNLPRCMDGTACTTLHNYVILPNELFPAMVRAVCEPVFATENNALRSTANLWDSNCPKVQEFSWQHWPSQRSASTVILWLRMAMQGYALSKMDGYHIACLALSMGHVSASQILQLASSDCHAFAFEANVQTVWSSDMPHLQCS